MLRVTEEAEKIFQKVVEENGSENLVYRVMVMGFG